MGRALRAALIGAIVGACAVTCAVTHLRARADDAVRVAVHPIELASALAPFFASLAEAEHGTATTRISWFGDSNIAFDTITSTVRARMQARFGDAGHGFVLVTPGHLPYGHRGVVQASRGRWSLSELIRGTTADGRYGYGGVLFTPGVPRASASFTTARRGDGGRFASRFEVLFQRHAHGGLMELRADGGTASTIDTRAEVTSDGTALLEVADGAHTFSLRGAGRGELRLYGVVLERAVPGVVLDSVGIVGARGKRLLAWDEEHLATQVAARHPQLVVIGFGANEASDAYGGDDEYAAETSEVVRRLRAGAPTAACLVLAPPDQAGPPAGGGAFRTYPTLARRVEVQRRVATAAGCAFWDTFGAMGGAGSMVRWRRLGLAARDHRHATAGGYERIATMLHDALMAALADYRDGEAARAVEAARASGAVRGAADAAAPDDAGANDAAVLDGGSPSTRPATSASATRR